MTGILNGFDILKVFIRCTYESSWNFPLIRHTWMLDAFPKKHFDIKEMLLLSILHWYSLAFGYKCSRHQKSWKLGSSLDFHRFLSPFPGELLSSKANLREQKAGMCAPGLLPLSLWGWEARSYFQGSMEEEFLSFIHFWGKTVASRQSAEDSEPDHLQQGLDTHPEGLLRWGRVLGRRCVAV